VEFELPSPHLNRGYFDLPEDAFVFLTSFDFHSSVSRKNPQAAIDAFLGAFPPSDTNVRLIVKSINGHLHLAEFEQIQNQAKQDTRIVFFDRHLSTEETLGLMQCANCYVSLHRSEGLGLGMAESMYLGKPVIATAYSGNMEFMNERNACLIPYEKIAVLEKDYPHAQNQVWANPSIEEASYGMKKMVSDPAWAQGLGKQAHADMLEHHSFATMGKAIKERLQMIALEHDR
jgi:glycosyltransferase involved in cell wall biosynthesis